MSILVIHIVGEGIILGADRNITETSTQKSEDGKTIYVREGQGNMTKVLKWPNNKALIGSVGVATIGKISIYDWLYNFIGRNLDFSRFDELSNNLKEEVQKQRTIDEKGEEAEGLIIHLAGFEERKQRKVPVVWMITNCHNFDPKDGRYTKIDKEFGVSEELWKEKYIGTSTSDNIRNYFINKAKNHEPFWFHQGFDLGAFNILDFFIKQSFRTLIKHNIRTFPKTLEEWSQYLSMSILSYAAYFQSFYSPNEQYVGGGVDIVSLPWLE